jgi:hypothetical protein
MPGQSIFADEWRDCLKSHYLYVVREQDVRTERTLRGVMHNVGFSEDELNELRVRATMHVDDVGVEFVPDLEILKTIEASVDLVGEVDVGATHGSPLPADTPPDEIIEMELVEEAETEAEAPVPYDQSGPEQLSLF